MLFYLNKFSFVFDHKQILPTEKQNININKNKLKNDTKFENMIKHFSFSRRTVTENMIKHFSFSKRTVTVRPAVVFCN